MRKILFVSFFVMILFISMSFNKIWNNFAMDNGQLLINKLIDQNIIQLEPTVSIKNVYRLMNILGYDKAIKYLLEHGLDINAQYFSLDNSWLNLLMIACKMNDIELAQMLINHGALLDEKNSECKTALFLSMSHKDSELVELLIKKGAQFNERDNRGNLAFFYAVIRNNLKAVKILVENGLNIKEEIRTFIYPMATQNIEMVELLINKDLNLNSVDDNGLQPLHYALMLLCDSSKEIFVDLGLIENTRIALEKLEENTLKIIDLLVKNGARIDQDNKIMSTFARILLNDAKLMKLFFEYGGNPNIMVKLNHMFSLLSLAVLDCNIEVIKFLLNKGADVNIPVSFCNATPLFFAPNKEIAQLIIEKCPDIDHRDIRGDTALNWAIIKKNIEVIDFLISKGADIGIKNFKDESVLDLARIYGNQSITDLLIKNGAK